MIKTDVSTKITIPVVKSPKTHQIREN